METLASLKALGRFVDSSQLTEELDGAFPYCHSEWVEFFQVSVTTPLAIASPPRGALRPHHTFCVSQTSLEKRRESPGEGKGKESSEPSRATPSCLLLSAPTSNHPSTSTLPSSSA